jgi:Mn-containing catalase
MNEKFIKMTDNMYVRDGIVYEIDRDTIHVTTGSTELFLFGESTTEIEYEGDKNPFERIPSK